MKGKIYEALKQEYSQLGLGDEILQAHADGLASTGLVTEQNLDSIVKGQRNFLEGLQKANDRRASEAANTAREKARKEFEEETKKKEEAAKKAAEDEAKKKAEEEAAKKAEEEAKKGGEIAELKNMFETTIKELKAQNEQNQKAFNEYKKSVEEKEKANAIKERDNYILNKARELGIPQSRIEEGFAIAADLDNAGIDTYLGKVATNVNATKLPPNNHQQMTQASEVSKEEVDKIVAGMC